MRALGPALLLLAALALPRQAHAQLGTVFAVAKWVPNRALDLLDVVRMRVRAGPGNALELRAGERLEYFRGGYRSAFVGLPGGRGSPWPRLPAGLEGRIAAPLVDGRRDPPDVWGGDPGYGRSETVFGFQVGFLGLEIGINPLQILDLGFGLIFLDPADDDW